MIEAWLVCKCEHNGTEWNVKIEPGVMSWVVASVSLGFEF